MGIEICCLEIDFNIWIDSFPLFKEIAQVEIIKAT